MKRALEKILAAQEDPAESQGNDADTPNAQQPNG